MNIEILKIIILIVIFSIFFYQQWKIKNLNNIVYERELFIEQEKLFCNHWLDCFMNKVYEAKDGRTVEERAKEINDSIKKMEAIGLEFENKVKNGEI